MKEKIELRSINVEFEAVNDNELLIEGRVNNLDWSKPLGERRRFIEKVDKGAFQRAITKASENHRYIDLLGNHNKSSLLASTQNESLILEERADGLYMKANLVPTIDGQNYYQLCKAGLFQEMSFGFLVPESRNYENGKAETWERQKDGTFKRYIHELELSEVSIVRTGAYNNTIAQLQARGIDVVQDPEYIDEEDVLFEIRNLTPEELQKMISETVTKAIETYVKPENIKIEATPTETVEEEAKQDVLETEQNEIDLVLDEKIKEAISEQFATLKQEVLVELNKKEEHENVVSDPQVPEENEKKEPEIDDQVVQDLERYKSMLKELDSKGETE